MNTVGLHWFYRSNVHVRITPNYPNPSPVLCLLLRLVRRWWGVVGVAILDTIRRRSYLWQRHLSQLNLVTVGDADGEIKIFYPFILLLLGAETERCSEIKTQDLTSAGVKVKWETDVVQHGIGCNFINTIIRIYFGHQLTERLNIRTANQRRHNGNPRHVSGRNLLVQNFPKTCVTTPIAIKTTGCFLSLLTCRNTKYPSRFCPSILFWRTAWR